MKIVHWVSKNQSGMHRMAEEIAGAELARGHQSICLGGHESDAVDIGRTAQIHVVHTYLPDWIDARTARLVYIAHGTPEYIFDSSIRESAQGHGASDPWMIHTYFQRNADAM